MPELELFGTAGCPFTRDAREALEWRRQRFVEHDVEADAGALARLTALTGQRAVPVLVHVPVHALSFVVSTQYSYDVAPVLAAHDKVRLVAWPLALL